MISCYSRCCIIGVVKVEEIGCGIGTSSLRNCDIKKLLIFYCSCQIWLAVTVLMISIGGRYAVDVGLVK